MKDLIKNMVQNAPESKMTRSDIFDYLTPNVSRGELRTALKELVNAKVLVSYDIPGACYPVTEYSLTEEWKKALIY